MWDNFIGQQIRRCNRNLLTVNLILLAAVIGYVAGNSRYLANFMLGAVDISGAEVARLHDSGERFRFFVRVHGDKSFETGIQSIEQEVDKYSNQVRSTTVKAEYRILAVGQKLLVVKADPSVAGETFTGALEPIPPPVYEKVITATLHEEPDLKDAFIPVMLNANDYREQGWWTVGIVMPLIALIGWNLWKWKRRFSDYRCHPIYRRLSSFGGVQDVVHRIETDLRMNQPEKIGKATIHGPWLFRKNFFTLTCFHLPDVIWIYEKVTKHSVNFIPTGKSYAVILNDRHGHTSEIQMGRKNAEALLGYVAQRYPWIVAGYNDQLKTLWQSQRASLVAFVEQRRSGNASAASSGK